MLRHQALQAGTLLGTRRPRLAIGGQLQNFRRGLQPGL